MPQYMLLIYTPAEGGLSPEEREAEMPKWFEYTEQLQRSGALVAGDALEAADVATTLRVRDGETLVSDGPFAEYKEHVAGYDLIEADSIERAVEIAALHPVARFGSIEVREVWPF